MTHYDKGAYFERELKKKLEDKGFFVIRAAGSGVAGDAPDLIVLRSGQKNKFGVECKAWKNAIYLDKPTVIAYKEWEKITGMQVFLAWKVPRKEWRFFPLLVLKETANGFSLSLRESETGMTLEQLTG
ncbi:MAG TPA: Holliday junction resolvase Hjc [Candidatus Norongarragalinales archaeon]|nr:Holliday junction resolvase Hjc [Candidatus Norongarragalinales archaeon]